MLALEIQRGKEGMKDQQYNPQMGATTGCCIRLTELCCFPGDDLKEGLKGDAWFGSARAATEAGLRGKMAGPQPSLA